MAPHELKAKWDRHTSARFPRGLNPDEIDGVYLVTAVSDMAGCIHSYLSRHALDPGRLTILAECCADLERVLPKVQDAHRPYFSELLTIGREVLSRVRAN